MWLDILMLVDWLIYLQLALFKGVGKERLGELKPPSPEILSSCYYVYKQLLQKDVQNLEKQEGKNKL